jgi:hypothetical protein
LIDQCIILVYKKNIVQIVFGEPKILSHICFLDKGFLEKKADPNRSEEYSSEQDQLIEKHLEELRKEYEELEQEKIKRYLLSMLLVTFSEGLRREHNHTKERNLIKKEMRSVANDTIQLVKEEITLDEDLDASLAELAKLRSKRSQKGQRSSTNAVEEMPSTYPHGIDHSQQPSAPMYPSFITEDFNGNFNKD